MLGGDSGGWTSAAADKSYAGLCEESAGFGGEVVGGGTGLGASEDRDLGTAVGWGHGWD